MGHPVNKVTILQKIFIKMKNYSIRTIRKAVSLRIYQTKTIFW